MLEINDLHVNYGAVHALNGVSMTVKDGEIVSLIGANGAGKSTTLKAIMGLVNKAEGNVYWDSTDITVMKTKDIVGAGLILCPEGRRIFPDLTVEENLSAIRTVSQRTEHGSTAFSHVCRKEPGSWERRSPAVNSRCWRSAER